MQTRRFVEAAVSGNLEDMKLLRRAAGFKSIDTDVHDRSTPLLRASANGRYEVVEWLLEEGAKADHANEHSITPLVSAVWHGYVLVAEVLLGNGADKDKRGPDFQTPLHFAVETNRLSMVKLLLRYGANPNLVGKDQKTPRGLAESFHWQSAWSQDQKAIINLLKQYEQA